MNTIDGDTRAKSSAAVSGRGVGVGVAVAVGVGDGVGVGVCVGSGDAVAVAVRVGAGGGAAVGVGVGVGDGVAVCVGTGVGVAEAVAVGVALGGTVGAAVDVACEAVGRSAVGSRQPFRTAAAATRARIEEARRSMFTMWLRPEVLLGRSAAGSDNDTALEAARYSEAACGLLDRGSRRRPARIDHRARLGTASTELVLEFGANHPDVPGSPARPQE